MKLNTGHHHYQQSDQRRPSTTNSLLNAKTIDQKKVVDRCSSIDAQLENCELKTLYKTSEIERLRLLELVKSLQKRIEELNDKKLEAENRLNEERRRSANLEKQIEKLKIQDNKHLGN